VEPAPKRLAPGAEDVVVAFGCADEAGALEDGVDGLAPPKRLEAGPEDAGAAGPDVALLEGLENKLGAADKVAAGVPDDCVV
jgi:hypothetical protein